MTDAYSELVAVSDRRHYRGPKKRKKVKRKRKPRVYKPKPIDPNAPPKKPYQMTEEHRAKCRANMQKALARRRELVAEGKLVSPSINPANVSRMTKDTIRQKVQEANIIEFATMMGFNFEGRPGQELTLRLLHGMGLPEGTVKTFVRVPCAGFVLEEREMSWLEYYTLLTGNKELFEPEIEPLELLLCVGARSGKTTIMGIETNFEATREEWRQYLRNQKEKAYACIIATNREQARDLIQQTCEDMFSDGPLEFLVQFAGKRLIELDNGLGIRSYPCNPRAPRGYPYFFTIYDEAAWWYVEGVNQDEGVHAAVNPRRMQFPGGKHVEISTPAAKQGRFYRLVSQGSQVHRRLTIKAPTWLFRPELHRINPEFLPQAYKDSPDVFNREYGAEFDETMSQFLDPETTKACLNLAGDLPATGSMQYMAGIDASGLSGNDKFGFAICGRDQERSRYVVPIVRSWPDTDAAPIMEAMKKLCQAFHVHYIFTDRYAKGWVHSAMRSIGLEPIVCPTADVVWLNGRKLIDGKNLDLPAMASLQSGLLQTQGSYTASNRLTILHPRDKFGHGDEAEAVMKAVYGASQEIYWSNYTSAEEAMMQAANERAAEEYDPLTHGRA